MPLPLPFRKHPPPFPVAPSPIFSHLIPYRSSLGLFYFSLASVYCSGLPEVSKTCKVCFCHWAFLLVPGLQNFCMIGFPQMLFREPLPDLLSRTVLLPCPSASLNPLNFFFFSKHFNTIWKCIVCLMAELEAPVSCSRLTVPGRE